MPSARSATAAPRRQPRQPRQAPGGSRTAPRPPQRVALRPPKLRVRWERVGRIGLLLVFGIVVALYVEHTLSYFSTRAAADQQRAVVQSLERQNAQLLQEQKSLDNPQTIIQDARALGMVRPGEQPYVILGH